MISPRSVPILNRTIRQPRNASRFTSFRTLKHYFLRAPKWGDHPVAGLSQSSPPQRSPWQSLSPR
jgi:hypothetical protein